MKKAFFHITFILLTANVFAQKTSIEEKISQFNTKIERTEKGERLQWMDSLNRIVFEKPAFNYDTIARQTIAFAIELDSLSLASKNLTDLIYYHVYIGGSPKEAISLFHYYSPKLKKLKNDYTWAELYLYTGDGYTFSHNLDKAISFYKKAIQFGIASKKEHIVALARLYMGFVLTDTGKFAEASLSFKGASQIYTKLKDTTNLLAAKNGLSILYSKNAFYKEAQQERAEAITIAQVSKNYNMLIPLYANAAEDYKRTGDRVKQIAYLKASLTANRRDPKMYYLKAPLLAAIANAYAESDSLPLAIKNFKALEAIYEKDKSEENTRHYIDVKKTLSFEQEAYQEALAYGKTFLKFQKERKKTEDIMLAEKFLAKVYNALDNNVASNEHLVHYYAIKDSIANVQNIKSLAYYQALYETEKRDLKIETQNSSIDILHLENKNKTQIFLFSALALLLLFGGLNFYRSFINAKKRGIAQKVFSQKLIKTQEQERARIAKDLHDGVGQQITLLKMKAQKTDQIEFVHLAHNALEEVRSISRGLYPVILSKLGLTESIEQLLLTLDEETDLFVSVEIDPIDSYFNATESLNFYRFIQESVHNVLKHAEAKTLIVTILKQNNVINVFIKDNGQGFEVSKRIKQSSLGLKTMAERISMLKGNFTIKSKKTEGTTITVQIPIK
jgi:signal transduction histidine kinase